MTTTTAMRAAPSKSTPTSVTTASSPRSAHIDLVAPPAHRPKSRLQHQEHDDHDDGVPESDTDHGIFDWSEDEDHSRDRSSPRRRPNSSVLGPAFTSSPKSLADSLAAIKVQQPPPQQRPQPRMRASWITDSYVESRRQSIAASDHGSLYSVHSRYSINGPRARVEIFQAGDRLGPGLEHDGHPIRIAHTSQGFRAQDGDDSGTQLEVVRKLGEGSYAIVYLVKEILPLSSDAVTARTPARNPDPPDEDMYGKTLRASEAHTNPDSPWSRSRTSIDHGTKAQPTGRKFALKCLCKRHLDDTHLEIQRLEATIHQSIGFHPNIVTLYRVYETPDWLFLVLEYCPGQDLYYWLERSQDTAGGLTPAASFHRGDFGSSAMSSPARGLSPKPLPSLHSNEPWDMNEDFENTPPNPSLLGSTSNLSLLSRRRLRLVSRMFRQMCEAVQFCHDKGISHRDLKPENFIVEDRRWFFDWEEEADAYNNDDTPDHSDDVAQRMTLNVLAATPTAASIMDQSRRFRSPDSQHRPSPSRSVSSYNRGYSSREGKVVVKLTDFGLATAEELCRDFDCGSKPYMAYECANDEAPYYDAKQADIWSLGVCLLNLIFHRSPFKEPNAERCDSFASFCYDPVKFLTEAFEGLTRDAAEFLAQNVFCEISDKYPDRTRISAKAFAEWAENLPEHMGLSSTDASRVLTRGPDPNITSPISHSRAVSTSSYLPFSFDVLGIPVAAETVPVERLPDYLQDVELPDELGDSTYLGPKADTSASHDEGNVTSEQVNHDGDATVAAAKDGSNHSDDSKDELSGGDGTTDGENESPKGLAKLNNGTAEVANGTTSNGGKPRRRKRGARKGRGAAKKDGEVPPESLPSRPQPPLTERDYAVDQLAAASQQLVRDLSKMKMGRSSPVQALSVPEPRNSAVPRANGSSPIAIHADSPGAQRPPNADATPSQGSAAIPIVSTTHPQPWRPHSSGPGKISSWRDRGSASAFPGRTIASEQRQVTTSAPPGLPGAPYHRPEVDGHPIEDSPSAAPPTLSPTSKGGQGKANAGLPPLWTGRQGNVANGTVLGLTNNHAAGQSHAARGVIPPPASLGLPSRPPQAAMSSFGETMSFSRSPQPVPVSGSYASKHRDAGAFAVHGPSRSPSKGTGWAGPRRGEHGGISIPVAASAANGHAVHNSYRPQQHYQPQPPFLHQQHYQNHHHQQQHHHHRHQAMHLLQPAGQAGGGVGAGGGGGGVWLNADAAKTWRRA